MADKKDEKNKIIRVGNSAGIVLKEKYLYASSIKLGDYVDITCSKNKIILKKKGG